LTARVIAAVPIDRVDYRPDPAARTALDLAWHIVGSEIMLLDGLATGAIVHDWPRPASVRSPADIVEWHTTRFHDLTARLRTLSPDQLIAIISFGLVRQAAVLYLHTAIRHSVHHRGQLSVYLRPMGARVPAIYGDSADETWADLAARMFGTERRADADADRRGSA
jgi:uncharacterized damage-inducible protein DinB